MSSLANTQSGSAQSRQYTLILVSKVDTVSQREAVKVFPFPMTLNHTPDVVMSTPAQVPARSSLDAAFCVVPKEVEGMPSGPVAFTHKSLGGSSHGVMAGLFPQLVLFPW